MVMSSAVPSPVLCHKRNATLVSVLLGGWLFAVLSDGEVEGIALWQSDIYLGQLGRVWTWGWQLDSLQICLLLRVGNTFWAENSLLFDQDVNFPPSYMPLLAPRPMSSDRSAAAPLLLPRAPCVLGSVWVPPPSTASSWQNQVPDILLTPK